MSAISAWIQYIVWSF